jgi:hypothetical protein
VTPDSTLRKILDELEANRRSRRTAWATLQRIRRLLEGNGAKITIPDNRNFETEGEAIERGVRRAIEHRDVVTLNLLRAVTVSAARSWLTRRRLISRPPCKTSTGSWRGPKSWSDRLDLVSGSGPLTSWPLNYRF